MFPVETNEMEITETDHSYYYRSIQIGKPKAIYKISPNLPKKTEKIICAAFQLADNNRIQYFSIQQSGDKCVSGRGRLENADFEATSPQQRLC